MKNSLSELITTVRKLRSPEGCPWDKKQTHQSLIKYFAEESQETLDALKNNDLENLCEELGDLLFLITLAAEIAHEDDAFNLDDIINNINKKMIRRHPHVFAGTKTGNDKELKAQWQAIKDKEKSGS